MQEMTNMCDQQPCICHMLRRAVSKWLQFGLKKAMAWSIFVSSKTHAETQAPLKALQGAGASILTPIRRQQHHYPKVSSAVFYPGSHSQSLRWWMIQQEEHLHSSALKLSFTVCELGADAFLFIAPCPVSLQYAIKAVNGMCIFANPIFNSPCSVTTRYLVLMTSLNAMTAFQNTVLGTRQIIWMSWLIQYIYTLYILISLYIY